MNVFNNPRQQLSQAKRNVFVFNLSALMRDKERIPLPLRWASNTRQTETSLQDPRARAGSRYDEDEDEANRNMSGGLFTEETHETLAEKAQRPLVTGFLCTIHSFMFMIVTTCVPIICMYIVQLPTHTHTRVSVRVHAGVWG